MKTLIVRILLHLYPAAWRREYGAELMDMLLARPLTVGVAGDVLIGALQQRVRASEPAMYLGLALLLVVVFGLVRNQSILPPTSNSYVLILFGCGVWTHLRHGGELSQSGKEAMKISFIAGIPVMVVGLLMLFGVTDAHPTQNRCWLRVSDASSPLHALQSATCPPAPLGVSLSPLFVLPWSWVWGVGGGALGREIARRWRRPDANS